MQGDKEEARCSGRGTCDRRGALGDRGACVCFDAFGSSDGMGGRGLIPDCGVFSATATQATAAGGAAAVGSVVNPNSSAYGCPVTTPLAGAAGLLCSGRGNNCSAASGFACNCSAGYTGNGCE